MKKRFPLWVEETKIRQLKERAKKENKSANKFILDKIEQAPNLVMGNWWDNPTLIKKIARSLKNEM